MTRLAATDERTGRGAAWRLALGVAGVALLLAGCNSLGGPGVPPPTASVFNNESTPNGASAPVDTQENARIVAAYGGIYHDAKIEQMLLPVVSRIVAASEKPDQPYRITILNAPAINAFALPGGYLYVTRGLLALANDSSEVAAVLAHEMGHVIANHAEQRQMMAQQVMAAAGAATDVVHDAASQQLALAASQRTLASFSRQQELEADAIGIRDIGKAGYDPYAAARFLSQMANYAAFRASATVQDKEPDFLATHPSTPERVSFAKQAASAFGAPGVGDVDRDRYLDGIDGMVFGDDPSQGFVRDRSFIHPGLAIAFTVPAGFVIDNTSEAVLATGGDGTALRFDAVGLAQGTDLADYLRSGWINGLDPNSIQSFSVNGLQAASASAQAKGWFFQIAVVQSNGPATYRFIFANETQSDAFKAESRQTVDSFRSVSQQELAQLKALHVHIVTAQPGDTEAIVARRMRGVDRPRELFQVLNDLQPNETIEPGTKLKIVDDR
jgi:predicted Zn-dependent protease